MLALEARRDPAAALLPILTVASVLWVLQRQRAAHHRRTRRRQWRRQIGTATLLAVGLWTAIALAEAVRDLFPEAPKYEDPEQPDRWPGAFLVDGIVSTLAIAGALTALGPRQHRRHRSRVALENPVIAAPQAHQPDSSESASAMT